MITESSAPAFASVVDTMVLAMFVDAGQLPLLAALARGNVFVPPSVVDPAEPPPFRDQPEAEFAQGVFRYQQRLGLPRAAVFLARRLAFYQSVGELWRPAALTVDEFHLARYLASPAALTAARAGDPSVPARPIGLGEAECAAVAVTRGWTLWTDDEAIVALVGALHSDLPVERISDLLIRAVRAGLLACDAAADLYNGVFKSSLGLWTRLSLDCENGVLVVR